MSGFSPFTFLHVNDYHMGTPRSYRFRPAINRRWAAIREQLCASDADLLLVGGDVTRDGDTHEYEYQQARENLNALPFPCHVIPGNMDVGNKHQTGDRPTREGRQYALDITSERLRLFASYFGPINWTFLHKEVRFSGFYAAVAGSGLPEEAMFWRFMQHIGELPQARHHVAVMHYWLYMDSPDEPTWDRSNPDEYLSWYFGIDRPHRERIIDYLAAAHVEVLFCGHVHTGRPVEYVGDMRVYKTPAGGNTAQLVDRWPETETRVGFQRCQVTADGIDVAFVPGDVQCAEFDTYGAGGHPSLAARDYSVAREQPPLAPDPWLL